MCGPANRAADNLAGILISKGIIEAAPGTPNVARAPAGIPKVKIRAASVRSGITDHNASVIDANSLGSCCPWHANCPE